MYAVAGVKRSDISEVVEGHVFIHPDDQLRHLTLVKKAWGDGVTTVFLRQEKFAHDPAVITANPTPDVTVECVSDLLGLEILAMVATTQSRIVIPIYLDMR